jgi:hypothetical protein
MGIFSNDEPQLEPEPNDDAAEMFVTDAKVETFTVDEPAPPPPPKPDPVTQPRPSNTYVLKQGDNPFKVALDLYGNGNRGRELAKANPGAKWQPGDVIKLL